MNHVETIEMLMLLLKLIKKERTGTPDELMKRLSISRGTLYNIIGELNSCGVNIKYSRTFRTFYFDRDVIIEITFLVKELSELDDP